MPHRFAFQFLCVVYLASSQTLCAQVAKELEEQSIGGFEVDELQLTQTERIESLIQHYAPLIEQAESDGQLTKDQRESREMAIREAIGLGLKGAKATKKIADAVRLTDRQRESARSALKLRNAFDRAVDELLTDAQRRKRSDWSPEAAIYSGHLVIRLAPDVMLPANDDKSFIDLARESGLTRLASLLQELGLQSPQRAISPATLGLIPPRHAKLARRLASYWRINAASASTQDMMSVLDRLNAQKEIDTAYRERRLSLSSTAAVDPSDDPYAVRQGYLDAAPLGINAKYAWSCSNGIGQDVGLVDLGTSWNLTHQDFAATEIELVYGDIKAGDHGTAALGEILANDNAEGVVGIAPGATYVMLTSWYQRSGADEHIASAVITALPLMYTGDVLLIEAQRGGRPTEIDDLDFDAIQLAVAEGMIVVEPAGNGRRPERGGGQVGFDLNQFRQDGTEKRILNRSSSEFRDSGAIMVGAADPRNANNRLTFSSYGNRLDCFSWGKFVTTTGYGDLDDGGHDPDKSYTRKYHGTSSAAPIIAGAAVIIQGMSIRNRGRVLSPLEMRAILSRPDTGTIQGSAVPGHIGVMPDLEKIIRLHSFN